MIWHILTTAPQRELRAQDALRLIGLKTMVPVEYRWHDAKKSGAAAKKGKIEKEVKPHPIWPRYVFVGCEWFQFPWREVYSLNHVGRPLITGALYRNGLPYALNKDEKMHVEHLTDVKKPEVPPDPSRRLYPGDKVRITDGPFAGSVATVHRTAKNGESVRVMVALFQSLAEATVPVTMVEAA